MLREVLKKEKTKNKTRIYVVQRALKMAYDNQIYEASLVADDEELARKAGDLGLIPGSGRSLGNGNGNPLHYSCLENPMDKGAKRPTVHGVVK